MKKLSLTLNLGNINKDLITTRTYTDKKTGKEVTLKEYKVDLVITDEVTILKETDTYTLKKVGFICDPTTKADREAGKKANYIGEAVQFVNKEDNRGIVKETSYEDLTGGNNDINPEDIPF